MTRKSGNRLLSEQDVDATLTRFMQSDLTVEEARIAIERLLKVRRRVIPRLLDILRSSLEGPSSQDETQLNDNQNAVLTLLSELGNLDVVDPLLVLVKDRSVQDDLKLKLISLILQLDPDEDAGVLFGYLNEPQEVLQRSQREHLEQIKSPSDLALWLEMMEAEMSAEARIGFIRANVELGDVSAVPLLTSLCYDPDDGVALAAIDAVERFKDARALPALKELAADHPSQIVQNEARKAADRLRIRSSLVPQAPPAPLAPLHVCYLTTMDGSGGQTIVVSRGRSDEQLELVNVMFNDHEGIKHCFGLETTVDELNDLLDEMAEQGISSVRVSHDECLAVLDLARETMWRAGRRLPLSYAAWQRVIEGRSEEKTEKRLVAFRDLVVPPEERDYLLRESHELLLQEEFTYWFFNPDELGDLVEDYLDRVEEQGGPLVGSSLRALLSRGVREIVTDRKRGLIRSRLERVASLLHELYEDDEVWQWAAVAADALADDSLLPLEEHPLLLGMVACSLENVIGEAIDWSDVL